MYSTLLQLSLKCCGWRTFFKISESTQKYMFLNNDDTLNYILLIYFMHLIHMSHFFTKIMIENSVVAVNLRCVQVISTSCVTWHICHITWPQMYHESLHRQTSIHEEKCCTFFSYFLSDTPFYKASLFFGHFWDISGWTSSIQPILF